VIKDFFISMDHPDTIEVKCDISPKKLYAHGIIVPIKSLYNNYKINKILLPFKNIGGEIKIHKIFILNALHPNAKYVNPKLLNLEKSTDTVFEYCTNPICFNTTEHFKDRLDALADTLSWWNFESSYWKRYEHILIDIHNDDQIFNPYKKRMIKGKKVKRFFKIAQLMEDIKVPLGKLINLHPDKFSHSASDILKSVML